MTAGDVKWLAGYLEGEGTFCGIPSHGKRIPFVGAASTDRDVILRVRRLVGVGYVCPYQPGSLGWKTQYKWGVGRENARRVMRLVLPHTGKRRSARIRQLLNGDLRTVAETERARGKR